MKFAPVMITTRALLSYFLTAITFVLLFFVFYNVATHTIASDMSVFASNSDLGVNDTSFNR